MTNENVEKTEVSNFEVEQILSDHPKYNRHEFTFTVDGNEFKGHFHEGKITWMHPFPKQIVGEEMEAKIEDEVSQLLEPNEVSNDINDFEMKQVFEDRPHERHQIILNVEGHEFKGLVHEGEVNWFHPHPSQKLTDEHIEAIETEILEKRGSFSKGDDLRN